MLFRSPPAGRHALVLAAARYDDVGDALRRLAGASWFRAQSSADQVRSGRLIAAAASRAHTSQAPLQARILTNTLGQLLPPGRFTLAWADLDRPDDGITLWGRAQDGRLLLARAVDGLAVDADADGHTDARDLADGSSAARQLFFGTLVHEVNHLVNGLHNASYARFVDEYRAWYVEICATFGRVPTRGEAWSRCQELLGRAYPDLQAALRAVDTSGNLPHPTEDGTSILKFLGEFYRDGHEPDPRAVASAVRVTGPWHIPNQPFAPAPEPSGNLDNR